MDAELEHDVPNAYQRWVVAAALENLIPSSSCSHPLYLHYCFVDAGPVVAAVVDVVVVADVDDMG